MDDPKKRKGNANCCVLECSHAYRNTPTDIVFIHSQNRKLKHNDANCGSKQYADEKVEQPPNVDQMVTFKSKCYRGRSSDKFRTTDCGLLTSLEGGDEVRIPALLNKSQTPAARSDEERGIQAMKVKSEVYTRKKINEKQLMKKMNNMKSKDDNNALSESAMRISYKICHEIAKELKTFNEGEFIKRCLITILADELCPQQVEVEAIRLPRRTVVRILQFNKKVHPETVRCVIRKAGYYGRAARKEPYISKLNRRKRFQFAKVYVNKDNNCRKDVLFTDENKRIPNLTGPVASVTSRCSEIRNKTAGRIDAVMATIQVVFCATLAKFCEIFVLPSRSKKRYRSINNLFLEPVVITDVEDWQKASDKVKTIEEDYWRRDALMEQEIEQIMINVGLSTSDDVDNNCEASCNESEGGSTTDTAGSSRDMASEAE
ncbi:hypothetical protein ANN_09324 [Periplaneta americana]|uniref:Transposase Tc1-like domain-containing protein n=1 Tax=Periplaneta americana TaxID=6978 RepID=A0ABQ8TNI9_PERAM|nr:hypothetical protein ANN_09324 [Periplaneta americana]